MGEGYQSLTIFNCPINLFLNSLPFKIPWWSVPSYSLLSTTIHAWRYIYPNSLIGPAPSAGGSVTGPPPGLQPGEIPNHPRIPRTKTRHRDNGRERERQVPSLQTSTPEFPSIFVSCITTGPVWSIIPSATPISKINLRQNGAQQEMLNKICFVCWHAIIIINKCANSITKCNYKNKVSFRTGFPKKKKKKSHTTLVQTHSPILDTFHWWS